MLMFSGLSLLVLPRLEINILQLLAGVINQGIMLFSLIQTLIII